VFFLKEILCHEKVKKQSVGAESENCAMANVTCELIWIRDLLTELGFALECPLRL